MSIVNLQGLLHDSLVATGHVECCTIIGRRDGAVKASSAGYEVWWTLSCLPHQTVKLPPPSAPLSPPPPPPLHTHTHTQPTAEQVDALISTFRETGTALDRGIHFNGAKYKCVRADKDSIYAKKASCELDYPVYGVTVEDVPTTGGLWVCGSEDRKSDHLWKLLLCHVPQCVCGGS